MRATWAVVLLGLAVDAAAVPPFKTADEQPIEYVGPGRDDPEPEVAEVRIAWFGPGEADAVGRPFWRGALLAQEEENAAGGYRGKPFRLLPAWSSGPWGAPVLSLTRRVFDDGVWAVIASADGAASHLAEQVAVKAGVAVVSPASTDPSVHAASSPWVFSLPPDDEAQAEALAGGVSALIARPGGLVIVAAAEHDASIALRYLLRALAAKRVTADAIIEISPQDRDFRAAAELLLVHRPAAVLVLAPAASAGRLVAELRNRCFPGVILGGAPLASAAFRRTAGDAAQDVIVPLWMETSAAWDAFASRHARRFGEPADPAAGYGYDAMRLVVSAIRRSGLNRARLRDALHDADSWTGVSGRIRWDARGRNRRPPGLGVWKGATVVPRDAS
jgi:branched-chain amino acid transport system substrate-binding protein